MIERLILGAEFRERLIAEAEAVFPRECCGLLEGVRDDTAARVFAVHRTHNTATRPDRFEIDPAVHIALLRGLRGTGREIVGCYHSHPNGTTALSDWDRQSAFDDEFLWLVIAIMPTQGDQAPHRAIPGERKCKSVCVRKEDPGLEAENQKPEGEGVQTSQDSDFRLALSLPGSPSRARERTACPLAGDDRSGVQRYPITTHPEESGFTTKLAAFVVAGHRVRDVAISAAP